MKKKVMWAEEVENVQQMLDQGRSLESIGRKYGVSRQRIYQILEKFGLDTPERKRKSALKDKEPKYYWLNRVLVNKGFSKEDRIHLIEYMDVPNTCPVLGIELNYNGTGIEGWTREENSPSVDRIDSDKGYTIDNIAIISWRANRIKNDGTAEEHRKIYEWLTYKL